MPQTPRGARRGAAPSTPAAGAQNEPAVEDPAVRVLRRFRIVFNAVRSHFQQIEKQVGHGGAQVWALSVIAREPGIGVGALARQMHIHQTTASNLVRTLIAQGLASAERKGTDRRAVQLHAQPEGLRVLERVPGPATGVLPQALALLDQATLGRLETDLDRLIAVLAADPRAGGVPLAQL